MQLKELTKAEDQVMQILWQIEKGFVKDIIEKMPEPKPAYNTVSTIVRILETKGFVNHNSYGKTHEYFPIISKDNKLDAQDVDALMKQLENLKKDKP
ncbi:MAG: BlaI/MecI/CopY family transcriptional regulator [Cytophagia bacterium]|nr:BlaI/MecI/CopY family transcriptional regulator [Cytophagia bacterium]